MTKDLCPRADAEVVYLSSSQYSSPGSQFRSLGSVSPGTSTSSCSSPTSQSTMPNTPMGGIKIEEVESDENNIKALPSSSASPTQPPIKRSRGRPRKNPLISPDTKLSKTGRTRTGCLTCRKRKKKCDENKPECPSPVLLMVGDSTDSSAGNNCRRNSYICEGYRQRVFWQSGEQKAEGK